MCINNFKKIVGVENKVNQNKLNPEEEEENININNLLNNFKKCTGCKYRCMSLFRFVF